MRFSILPFGALTDTLSASGISLTNEQILTIEDLHQYLTTTYPAIAQQKFRYAVNQEMVDSTHSLQDGDEIALLPPFSGG
ncbi:MoaD/ThiS family protein [Xanthocytophaga agilis]|uniref:Molybdopterin synthase sulfur carrier subunit n=1 Tax=Xanthocytophaga agilis TaxID=3048010 RepID=A0AAE3RC21_9BACT|nr:MoaD/ThiS family protein [Xanthocytophaga agilis]MDJ1505570.1 MoaD/ThiS family protein [Xanthocytophaga agilis]